MSEEQRELALRQDLSLAIQERYKLAIATAKKLVAIKNDKQLTAAIEVYTQLKDFHGELSDFWTEFRRPYRERLKEIQALQADFDLEPEITRIKGLITEFEGALALAQQRESERQMAIVRARETEMRKETDELKAIQLHKEALEAQDRAFEVLKPTAGITFRAKWDAEILDWVKIWNTNPQLLYPPTLNKLALNDLLKRFKDNRIEITPDMIPGIKLTETPDIRIKRQTKK